MKLLPALAIAFALSAPALAAPAPDAVVVTGPNLQQIPIGRLLVTPIGGTQATLGFLLSGPGLNLTSPSPIGSVTPNTGAFTTLGASGPIGTSSAVGYQQNGHTIFNSFGVGDGSGFSIAIGVGAAAATSNTDHGVVAIGYQALNVNNNGNSENTAVGWGSQRSNTTGQFNTTLGLNTMGMSVTDNGDTIVGLDAMRDSTGSFNAGLGANILRDGAHTQEVAVGYNALTSNGATSSNTSANVAVGYNVMSSTGITTASNNTAVGASAGSALTSGSSNAFLGNNAGLNTTTGSENVDVGQWAGSGNTTGGPNVAIGWNALVSNQTHSFYIAIGDNALNSTTNSGWQIGIGHNAMAHWNSLNNAESFATVAIGPDAFSAAGATGDHDVLIGVLSGAALTSGSNITAIGANVASVTCATATNVLLLGVSVSTDCGSSSEASAIHIGAGAADIISATGTGTPSTSTTTVAGILNAVGVYKANGTAGVSCAANTVSLTTLVVTNGIVTHC